MAWLTDKEKAALELVLEPRPASSSGGKAKIEPLSFYSSELKPLKQLASGLMKVQDGTFPKQEERTRNRYFRTLRIHGVVGGSADAPTLTPESQIVFSAAAGDDGSSDYWQRNRDLVEGPLVRTIAEKLAAGQGDQVQDHAKRVFWNVQFLLDVVPEAEIRVSLKDLELLALIQFMNVVGFEPARYFRLPDTEKSEFRTTFTRLLRIRDSAPANPSDEISRRAKYYCDARGGNQEDIRFRVAGFITAYLNARDAMGTRFPRLTRNLKVANMTDSSSGTVTIPTASDHAPLGPLQLIVSGCPGSGKSFWLDQQLASPGVVSVRTQFHAETSYYDFVGSYKPVPVYETLATGVTIRSAGGEELVKGRPLISYEFVPGPLVDALVKALGSPDLSVVLVIEELNRGNCAAIFGDMFQLLDRGTDGFSRYGVNLSQELRAHLIDANVLKEGETLQLPPNLYLWATMNSADQGVFPLDTAFRRRWDFIYRGHGEPCAYPDDARKIRYGGSTYDWDAFRSVLNGRLRGLKVHEDKLIGPYFLTQAQLGSADAVLNKLFLYLWDDVQRFHQDELFLDGSFAEVAETWASGNGKPLRIELDVSMALEGEETVKAGADHAAGTEMVDAAAPLGEGEDAKP